jgi:hypothetical protein
MTLTQPRIAAVKVPLACQLIRLIGQARHDDASVWMGSSSLQKAQLATNFVVVAQLVVDHMTK